MTVLSAAGMRHLRPSHERQSDEIPHHGSLHQCDIIPSRPLHRSHGNGYWFCVLRPHSIPFSTDKNSASVAMVLLDYRQEDAALAANRDAGDVGLSLSESITLATAA